MRQLRKTRAGGSRYLLDDRCTSAVFHFIGFCILFSFALKHSAYYRRPTQNGGIGHPVERGLDLFGDAVPQLIGISDPDEGPTTVLIEVIHAGRPVFLESGLTDMALFL